MTWILKIFGWPYFPACENQKLVGDREQKFEISAEDFDNALIQARAILTGVKTNSAIWKAGISALFDAGV
jgi:hypothetical protein